MNKETLKRKPVLYLQDLVDLGILRPEKTKDQLYHLKKNHGFPRPDNKPEGTASNVIPWWKHETIKPWCDTHGMEHVFHEEEPLAPLALRHSTIWEDLEEEDSPPAERFFGKMIKGPPGRNVVDMDALARSLDEDTERVRRGPMMRLDDAMKMMRKAGG